jgi:hypothetical protein
MFASVLLVALLAAGLSACGDRAAHCTPLHKGFPLCGL